MISANRGGLVSGWEVGVKARGVVNVEDEGTAVAQSGFRSLLAAVTRDFGTRDSLVLCHCHCQPSLKRETLALLALERRLWDGQQKKRNSC